MARLAPGHPALLTPLLVGLLAGLVLPQSQGDPPPLGELVLLATRERAAEGEWVRGGLPLARAAEVRDPREIQIFDAAGAVVPASIRALSRWDAPVDDARAPLRWVAVTFATTAGPLGRLVARRRLPPAADPATPAPGEGPFRVVARDGCAEIARKGADLVLGLVDAAGARTGPGLRPLGLDVDGKPIAFGLWTSELVDADPLATTVRASCAGGGLVLEAFVRATRGSREFVVDLRVLNPGPYGWGPAPPATVHFRRLALTLPAPADFVALGSAGVRVPREELGAGLRFLQGIQRDGAGETLPREVWVDGERRAAAPESPGVLAWELTSGSLAVGVERFRENAPRALSADGRTAVFDFFPLGGHGPEYRGRYGRPDRGEADELAKHAYRFEGGRAKSVRLRFRRGPRAAAELARTLDAPIFAAPSRASLAASGALGASAARPDAADPDSARFERILELFVSDAVADPLPELGRIGLPAFRRRGGTWGKDGFHGWFDWGDLPWGDGYCSLHYDLPFSMLLAGLRRGDARFLELGQEMSRHRRDIDQDHDRTSNDPSRGGQAYEKGFWHGNFESPKLSHLWLRGPVLHWWLTGDEWSEEAARLGGEFLRRQRPESWNGTYGARIPGWSLDNLLCLWTAFGDPADLRRAEGILAAVEKAEGGRGFIVNPASKPRRWKPWMHAILVQGVARYEIERRDGRALPLLRRLAGSLRDRAVRRERGTLALDRLHDGKRGEEPSIHLLWPAAAAFALTAEATGDATFAREAATLFRFAVRHQQGRAENPITFRMQGYPGSESKVLSNIALWGQAALPTLSPR